MYRFLLTPKWLLGHALVAVVVVSFPALGFWQLDRLEQVRGDNALIDERLDAAPVALTDVLADGAAASDVTYRRAEVTGIFRPSEELLLTGRSAQEGRPGHHVLTPLEFDGDRTVLVDRGWVPYELDDPPIAEAAPPAGEVTVTGFLRPTEPSRSLGPRTPEGGAAQITAVDLERLDRQIRGELVAAYLHAQQMEPPAGALPAPVAPPEVGEGNHLAYAVQWFTFAGIVALGYPVLIVRTGRDRDRDAVPARPA